ncbi:ras-related protein Rab-30 isoform X1 [Zeugodacus cucurbitae]|uniref:Ras-related protein Rab-30 n=1 Tax=Zeugodacus cucurbitae TaxID=28588 RepID=A0A0A1WFF7_ZEUCU|nr:ras-related protein Rab-30 isoform X1 [Zeugodacus cucurbitae]XP_011190764.1 ras-related protein Rab-30 isoform X1 [Zeugodacus cucurbitae]XP_028899390.1 ras-related protein Rab-30 isoform X1 [Zeugodacus cucurbitae]XP_054083525.1 ras-related protein Rab-30 isoform X1 [Zeugodacus cucurbitae]
MEDYKFLFKIVLVGNAGVGKTCLVRRFTQGLFPPGQGATIGVDFMIKTVEVEGEKIKLQIWDTAGQERFRSITQSYYRSAHALILVYDISCQPTFDCLPDWLREIQEYANSKVLKILVGNKTDRDDREIPTQIGEEFAKQHDMYFLETSAKEAENVERLFYEIAAELIDQARSKDGSNANKTTADAIGLGNFGTKATQNSCCSGFSSNTGQTNSESSNSRSNT